MDIAVCAYYPATQKLEYAGAYNPCWIIRNGTLIELAPDKQPIGAYAGQEQKPFTLKEVQLRPGDRLYLFSDGYADQFGGPRGKKFKYIRLKELLLKIAAEPMEKQKRALDETIEAWRGSFEQIDDILVMGISV
jgi:serine phosphatase RsbU (regulator of sigma subunit)